MAFFQLLTLIGSITTLDLNNIKYNILIFIMFKDKINKKKQQIIKNKIFQHISNLLLG